MKYTVNGIKNVYHFATCVTEKKNDNHNILKLIKTTIISKFSMTFNQVLSTGCFKFCLSRLPHWYFPARINAKDQQLLETRRIDAIHSSPNCSKVTLKRCFWVSNKMDVLNFHVLLCIYSNCGEKWQGSCENQIISLA